ncbi:Dual specificity mitogen-activated protein kinase kinase 6 [Xenoophorus captivus]|uniref:mitogen-activated protein kinase kinase n=1 Tax=Xenoophorus captivus TaxID=1517983 RepID=A0ABV0RZS9_9TELE
MKHVPSGVIMAVKRIRATVNTLEQKRLLMDLDISMRTVDCFYTVTFYGALFREGDVWICMELMDTSLDKFYKKVIQKGQTIPEDILGKITVAIVKALEHLHHNLSVIHRGKQNENLIIIDASLLLQGALCLLILLHFVSRCEALQCPDQRSGPSENVRLWHQRPPGGFCGQNNGRRLQAIHGGKG